MRRHEPYGSPGGLSPRERGRIQLAAAIVLAVTVVLSVGPAVATHLVVRSSDIVNGQVKAVDLGLGAVTTGKVANGAITSSKIRDDGVTRADLAPGVVAARAFGTIWWPGTIVSNSQNLSAANVSRPSTGQYCIFGLPFTPVNAVATGTNGWNAGLSDVHVWGVGTINDSGNPCPAGTQTWIRVYNQGSTTLGDSNFNIIIF